MCILESRKSNNRNQRLDTVAAITSELSRRKVKEDTTSACAYCWTSGRKPAADRAFEDDLAAADAAALMSHMTRLGSPRTLSSPTARRFGLAEENDKASTLLELRVGNVSSGPLNTRLFLASLFSSRFHRSTFPVLAPTAMRLSKEGSGDHAKHCRNKLA